MHQGFVKEPKSTIPLADANGGERSKKMTAVEMYLIALREAAGIVPLGESKGAQKQVEQPKLLHGGCLLYRLPAKNRPEVKSRD